MWAFGLIIWSCRDASGRNLHGEEWRGVKGAVLCSSRWLKWFVCMHVAFSQETSCSMMPQDVLWLNALCTGWRKAKQSCTCTSQTWDHHAAAFVVSGLFNTWVCFRGVCRSLSSAGSSPSELVVPSGVGFGDQPAAAGPSILWWCRRVCSALLATSFVTWSLHE